MPKCTAIILTSCLLTTLVSGCSLFPAPTGAHTADGQTGAEATTDGACRDFKRITDFTEWLYSQPAQDLLPLYQQAQQQVETGHASSADEIRLALLLSVPETPFRDDKLALLHLQEARRHESRPVLLAFINLQQLWLNNRQRQQQQWQQQLQQERRRRANLEHQLEQLKDIETDLGPRNGHSERTTP